MKRLVILSSLLSGCAWSTFDDIADKTPAHAVEKPDAIKATDYGMQIVGVSVDPSGGRLAILSSGSGNFSTLEFDAKGKDSVGVNEPLGDYTIESLTSAALLIGDGMGRVAVIDNSNSTTVVVAQGPATSGLVIPPVQGGTPQHPDAATFTSDGKVIVTVTAPTGMPNAFAIVNGAAVQFTLTDGAAMPISAAAIAADATSLYAWTKTGALLSYPLSGLTMGATVAGAVAGPAITPAPANGASFQLLGAKAVLTSFDSATSMTGSVSIVDLASATQIGSTSAAPGAHSASLAMFGSQAALVIGFPNRTVDSTANVGEVEIRPIDGSGNLQPPSETIHVPQADANLAFGRSVSTMKHNGSNVLVVGASNTVFAYYKTSLYADTRTP